MFHQTRETYDDWQAAHAGAAAPAGGAEAGAEAWQALVKWVAYCGELRGKYDGPLAHGQPATSPGVRVHGEMLALRELHEDAIYRAFEETLAAFEASETCEQMAEFREMQKSGVMFLLHEEGEDQMLEDMRQAMAVHEREARRIIRRCETMERCAGRGEFGWGAVMESRLRKVRGKVGV